MEKYTMFLDGKTHYWKDTNFLQANKFQYNYKR